MKRSPLILGLSAALTLGACALSPEANFETAQYWQRANVSESAYMYGPKAQQMLNRDISRCVVELRELERLGSVRNAIPTDTNGRVLDPDQRALRRQDTPERDNHLFMEQSDYHDFEGCMLATGWERVKSLPYDRVEVAHENYLDAHVDYQDRALKRKAKKSPRGYNE